MSPYHVVLRQALLLQVEAIKQAGDWTLGMAAFDSVLAALNQAPTAALQLGDAVAAAAAAPASKPAKKRRRQDGTAAAEPGPDAPGAQAPAPRKKRRKAPAGTPAAADPDSTGAAAEYAQAARVAAQRPGPATERGAAPARVGGSHLARFSRRRRCKDVRSYSGADLAAILGAAPGAAPSAGVADGGVDPAAERLRGSATSPPAHEVPGEPPRCTRCIADCA